ncbi:AIPR family protein [Neptunicella sp.]|uniref:AIPR family protein n=1 Tax=Neptunicella sp. TaxID=2125986 RepID=UPI003F694D81
MARNDAFLLDGIIDERVENQVPSCRRDEAFEYLAFEQWLKPYDLSKEEILFGSVDGRDDGGIDGFYIFINGHLLMDLEGFAWPRSGSLLEIRIITCKHHETFKQAPLDNLAASLSELFDFSTKTNELKGNYSNDVVNCRENLKFAYRKLSPRLSSFNISYAYASRGNTQDIGDAVVARAKQISSITKDFFGNCEAQFEFVGASELIALHRMIPNFSLELKFSEVLSSGERYVLLANLNDYYQFISDNGKLRRYLFDSNVRDFMGLNRVNEDIKSTLENNGSTDFWCLNNGVTLLATSASVVGDSINLEDIQIVNGLQTSESIFRYFEAGGIDSSKRSVLVKVIVSQEEEVRDSIIRATNNQTDVELASLHATDKIQRDIEDVFERSDFYYERRKNYHHNIGNPSSKTITPLYLASGVVNLILKLPQKASNLKSKFMRSDEAYNLVFSEHLPISIYPIVASVLKTTDQGLESFRSRSGLQGERFLKRWRQITSLIAVSRLFGKYDFTGQDLSEFQVSRYSTDLVEETWKFIEETYSSDVADKRLKGKGFFVKLCKEASAAFSISNPDRIEKAKEFWVYTHEANPIKERQNHVIDMEFALKVNELLPEQPWKPGVNRIVKSKLGCSNREYFEAVQILIDEGIRNKQRDGVVYDYEGNVVAFDSERVDPNTMKLLDQ